jgi:hypothetical protein
VQSSAHATQTRSIPDLQQLQQKQQRLLQPDNLLTPLHSATKDSSTIRPPGSCNWHCLNNAAEVAPMFKMFKVLTATAKAAFAAEAALAEVEAEAPAAAAAALALDAARPAVINEVMADADVPANADSIQEGVTLAITIGN